MTTVPSPAMLAGMKKPDPPAKPVKRRRGPRIGSHVDPATVAALRKLSSNGKKR